MSTDLTVSASAQAAIARRMEAIANNIANVNTAGFRASGVKFEQTLTAVGEDEVSMASAGYVYIKRDPGPVSYTGNDLDVAVDGDGWLALKTPEGTVYSRDGRMHMSDAGELLSVNGYQVLDPGGGPITIDPSGGAVTISEDGGIIQGGKQVGAIGMFLIPADADLSRYDNAAVIPDRPVEAVADLTTNGMRQGYVEGSNVNPIIEMTRMIEISRAFDQAASAIDESDNRDSEAIQTLSPTG